MKKIIFVCAIAVAAVLTSCEKKEAQRTQVVDNVYAEQVEGGYSLAVQYGEGQFSTEPAVYDKIVYNKETDLVLAYTGKTFSIFTKDGNVRGDGGYEAYKVDGDVVYFAKAGKTMLYTKKGIIIGTFAKDEFVIDHNKIFTKNPKGFWNLRNLDGDFLTDMSYEKIYIIDLKEDGSYDKLCYREGTWTMIGHDGGRYDQGSTSSAVKALKKKNPSVPVGVVDI